MFRAPCLAQKGVMNKAAVVTGVATFIVTALIFAGQAPEPKVVRVAGPERVVTETQVEYVAPAACSTFVDVAARSENALLSSTKALVSGNYDKAMSTLKRYKALNDDWYRARDACLDPPTSA